MSEARPRVLVTGASGFVGRAVMAAFASRDVAAIPVSRSSGVDLFDRSNVRLMLQRERPTHLLHLAWYVEHGAFWSSPLNEDWRKASLDLFKAFRDQGGQRIVGTGTCAEYDWKGLTAPLTEDAPVRPASAYGAAKAETARALTADGGSSSWARLFFLFGRGEPPGRLIPQMISACAGGAQLDMGPPDLIRDFWPVEALGEALARLTLSDLQGPVNLASGAPVSFGDIARTVEEAFGVSGLINLGARPANPSEPAVLAADTGLMRRALGIEPADPLSALRDYARAW